MEMKRKKLGIIAIAGGLMAGGSFTPVYASFGDAVAGGIVGGVVGSVITNEIYHSGSRRSTTHRSTRRRRHYYAPARQVMTDEKRIQQALKNLGYYRGPIDGQINSFESRTAIKEFNRAYEISDSAYMSPQERDALIYLGTLLQFDRNLITQGNDSRSRTRRIQTALKVLGFYSGKIDGSNGPMTRRAIAEYKAANGMIAGYRLGYEEEYRLVETAKKSNDRNIEETIASLKRLGGAVSRPGMQPAPGTTTVVPNSRQQMILQPAQPPQPAVQGTIVQEAQAPQPETTTTVAPAAATAVPSSPPVPQPQQTTNVAPVSQPVREQQETTTVLTPQPQEEEPVVLQPAQQE